MRARVFLASLSVAFGLVPAWRTRSVRRFEWQRGSVEQELLGVVSELREQVAVLSGRVTEVQEELKSLRESRLSGLEAEAAALRSTAAARAAPKPPSASARSGGVGGAPGLQSAMAARAMLGSIQGKAPAAPATTDRAKASATLYDPDEVEALGGEAFFFEKDDAESGKNDAFLDDDLEDLLAIGGDPSFLEQSREGFKSPKKDDDEPWDGVIDESAYFDDDF